MAFVMLKDLSLACGLGKKQGLNIPLEFSSIFFAIFVIFRRDLPTAAGVRAG